MKSVRANDRWSTSEKSLGPPIIAPILGFWFNCNPGSGEIRRLELIDRDGLILRSYGADGATEIDWGETPADPFVIGLESSEVNGFTASYDFKFMETSIAANVKYGVLVIQSYNRFRDASHRPSYFTREFFHQNLTHEPIALGPPDPSIGLPTRMVGDRLTTPADPGDGLVDLTPWLGSWRNTYRGSKGIRSVVLEQIGDGYTIRASGTGSIDDWGCVPLVPHADGVTSHEPSGFLARFDFGFADLVLSANMAKGLLIIASFMTFRDSSGRSSYFTREFFYRESIGNVFS